MDRGAWRATVHALARVGHDLATKPPPLLDPEEKSFQPGDCLLNVKHTLLFRIKFITWGEQAAFLLITFGRSLYVFFSRFLKHFLNVVIVTVKHLVFNKQIHCQHRILGQRL